MSNYGYVYKVTNLTNKKIYIGKKKGEFMSSYLGSGLQIIAAIKKYGKENFSVEILKYAIDKKDLNELEKFYITEYRQGLGRRNLYNISDGGDGGTLVHMFGSQNPMYGLKGKQHPCYGKHLSEDHKNKIGKSNILPREIRECTCGCGYKKEVLFSSKWKSKRGHYPRTEQINEKSRKSHLGENNPSWGRCGEGHPIYGKHHTEESNEKNRQKHLGKVPWNKGLTKETDNRVLQYTQIRLKKQKVGV